MGDDCALVNRSAVADGRGYDEYRETLRGDFLYSCAYCSVAEAEAAAFGFEIDHYHPQSQGGSDEYSNLYWSCEPCNNKKGDFWPPPEMVAQGKRLIRIDREDPACHFRPEAADVRRVEGITPIGAVTVLALDLNSLRMRRIREIRSRYGVADRFITNGLRLLANARLDQLEPEVRVLLLKLRASLLEASEIAPDAIAEVIRRKNRSELIDRDPEQGKRNQARLKQLRREGVLPTRVRR
ncbi:MAG: HNH endonuclease [Myxococcales bacterium]|nr:HNH endonuclease [Myxococcales bacterium]